MKVIETWAHAYLQHHPDATCVRVGVEPYTSSERVWVDILGSTRGSTRLHNPEKIPPLPTDVEAEAARLIGIGDFEDFENIPVSILGGSAKITDPKALSFDSSSSVLTNRSAWVGFRTRSGARMPHE